MEAWSNESRRPEWVQWRWGGCRVRSALTDWSSLYATAAPTPENAPRAARAAFLPAPIATPAVAIACLKSG